MKNKLISIAAALGCLCPGHAQAELPFEIPTMKETLQVCRAGQHNRDLFHTCNIHIGSAITGAFAIMAITDHYTEEKVVCITEEQNELTRAELTTGFLNWYKNSELKNKDGHLEHPAELYAGAYVISEFACGEDSVVWNETPRLYDF